LRELKASATMGLEGGWRQRPRYGEQVDPTRAVERKPASAAALEKYLGSGPTDPPDPP
jgi:exodeoxyribonuclease V alpha subunit